MSSCCCSPPPEEPKKSAEVTSSCCDNKGRIDWLLWVSLALMFVGYIVHLAPETAMGWSHLLEYGHGVFSLMNKMWWGLALGILAVGVLGKVPREWVAAALGKPGTLGGILRAMGAGLLLDLCNHGILLVAMKLYQRGASLGQTLAFIIASPWNSLSLTLILLALIGPLWTLLFIVGSALIAVITGLLVEGLVKKGKLPSNKNQVDLPDDYHLGRDMKQYFKNTKWSLGGFLGLCRAGFSESGMILRWIFLGTVLAAALRSGIPEETFSEWFGPTWIGILLTLLAATIIEVCSEGSSPIAADLVTRAAAPGNGFAFLMAGAATDYTEIMALKETTRSWKGALVLPLLTLPQVVLIAWLMNVI